MTQDDARAAVAAQLEALGPWLDDWALPTQAARERRRRSASTAQLQAFYDAMLPRMDDIITALDAWPLHELPADARRLMDLTLSLAEVAPHVEFYDGEPGVPFAFAEERFIAERAARTQL